METESHAERCLREAYEALKLTHAQRRAMGTYVFALIEFLHGIDRTHMAEAWFWQCVTLEVKR